VKQLKATVFSSIVPITVKQMHQIKKDEK
jgi:hypothetical protein